MVCQCESALAEQPEQNGRQPMTIMLAILK
jgi:hypothetical protein